MSEGQTVNVLKQQLSVRRTNSKCSETTAECWKDEQSMFWNNSWDSERLFSQCSETTAECWKDEQSMFWNNSWVLERRTVNVLKQQLRFGKTVQSMFWNNSGTKLNNKISQQKMSKNLKTTKTLMLLFQLSLHFKYRYRWHFKVDCLRDTHGYLWIRIQGANYRMCGSLWIRIRNTAIQC